MNRPLQVKYIGSRRGMYDTAEEQLGWGMVDLH